MTKSLEITKAHAMLIEGGAAKPILVLLGNHIWNMVPSSSAPASHKKTYKQYPLYTQAVLNWGKEWMVASIENIKKAPVTFADFEIRNKGLRGSKAPNCTFKGCKNPRNCTESTCFYHRVLFDRWLCDLGNSRARCDDKAFYAWIEKCGKLACDRMVLEFAQAPINWVW